MRGFFHTIIDNDFLVKSSVSIIYFDIEKIRFFYTKLAEKIILSEQVETVKTVLRLKLKN